MVVQMVWQQGSLRVVVLEQSRPIPTLVVVGGPRLAAGAPMALCSRVKGQGHRLVRGLLAIQLALEVRLLVVMV